MEYMLHIIIFILLYSIFVQSLNLIMGYAGIVSMCHAIFSAIGAYTAAIISIKYNINFIVPMACGFIIAASAGALVAIPSLRVKDEYLIAVTIGFQMVMYEILLTARSITEGQGGIPGIPSAIIFGYEFDNPYRFLFLAVIVTVICFVFAYRLINSPFGRTLKAIRENESASRAIGKNSTKFKILVFSIGGGIAAIGGSLMAYYLTFVSPFTFVVEVSIFFIVMVVLGGAANFWGPLIGAAILVGLPEGLRFIPGAAGVIDAIREILYGLILMLLMIFRPQGIFSEKPRHQECFLSEFNNEKSEHSVRFIEENTKKVQGGEIVRVDNVSKFFGGLKAVDNVSIQLFEGTTTALIGPNGCGKTTLFNVMTGYLKQDTGKVYLKDKNISNLPSYEIVSHGLARSWQDVRIFNGMSILENVLTACPRQRGEEVPWLCCPWSGLYRDEKESYQRALYYLSLVGLSDKVCELAGNVSTSEQKLVAIARLLATECSVLMLDEPTAALDIDSVNKIIKLIKSIAIKTRKTILLVEHNLDVVRGLVENAYFMSEGKILDYGTPAKLMGDPKLVEVYFGID